ncbi:MAG: hypothetical protein KatS3mg057_2346 [Herpetosiphonaceae bacterium]|nr:MAG: hypothetical protein KatS3mg057_2346 [Herpetosiphonaceae bacterium]
MLVHEDQLLVNLTIDGELIATTPEHPFYTLERGWVEAADLLPGERVRNADGELGIVEAVQIVLGPATMYNLTVAIAHTFFVGDGEWLVHNCGSVELFYHATTSDVVDSIRRGIDLSRSRPDLDFNPSGQGGFYVTRLYAQAEEWASRLAARRGTSPAILEFHIPTSELARLNGKVFTAATEEWAEWVVAGRSGTLYHSLTTLKGRCSRIRGRCLPDSSRLELRDTSSRSSLEMPSNCLCATYVDNIGRPRIFANLFWFGAKFRQSVGLIA